MIAVTRLPPSYWILKFDGVRGNKDKEMEDPQGYGAIEYAYSLMALDAGITMEECRLMEEGGRQTTHAKSMCVGPPRF